MNASEWIKIEEQVRAEHGHDWKAQRKLHFQILHVTGPQKKSANEMIKYALKCEGFDWKSKRRKLF